jgi:hypothetical protein
VTRDGRRLTIRETGPGRGRGVERDPERATMLAARIAIIATIVVGQLWGLTVALNSWQEGDAHSVVWLLVFEVVSFLIALGVWLIAPGEK